MHPADIQRNAPPAARRGFHGRAGEAGRAQILQRTHPAGGKGFQAGLDQRFLQEGVADLHRGPEFLFFLESTRRQSGRAVDSVAAGARARQQQDISSPVGGRAGQIFDARDADAHGVHQRVLRIAVVEVNLAGHIGHADAVAIPADAVNDAFQQPPVRGRVRRAETERVEQGDGARAHGEDVAHDAADAGGRALQRLHRRRVVVGLHLENHRQPVADVDGSGILSAGLREGP